MSPRILRIQSLTAALLLTLCMISNIGCGDGEEQHLEHFVPAHKPASFGELVEQIFTRVEAAASAESDVDASVLKELKDIIEWIPELAADSDLRKADWEHAVALGVRLQALWTTCFGPQASSSDRQAAVEKFSVLQDELRQLAEAAVSSSGM